MVAGLKYSKERTGWKFELRSGHGDQNSEKHIRKRHKQKMFFKNIIIWKYVGFFTTYILLMFFSVVWHGITQKQHEDLYLAFLAVWCTGCKLHMLCLYWCRGRWQETESEKKGLWQQLNASTDQQINCHSEELTSVIIERAGPAWRL